jgi:hypothetical protein
MINAISEIKTIGDIISYTRLALAKNLFTILKIDPSKEITNNIIGLFNLDQDALLCDGNVDLYGSDIFNLDDNEIEELFINKYGLKITVDKFQEAIESFNVTTNDMFDISLVEQDGGGEGGSEYCSSVLKIGDKFFRINYTYQSHVGFDFWEGSPAQEVHPQKVEVIKYL